MKRFARRGVTAASYERGVEPSWAAVDADGPANCDIPGPGGRPARSHAFLKRLP